MRAAGRVALLALAAAIASRAAEPLTVCVADRVRLGPSVQAAFEEEFLSLTSPGVKLDFQCAAPVRFVPVTILPEPPRSHPEALGLAYAAAGRILPRLEVYLNPTLRMLAENRAPRLVGRALARVAAHELAHFQLQKAGHDETGLLREGFRPEDLRASTAPVPDR
jgi:hypothetical protein